MFMKENSVLKTIRGANHDVHEISAKVLKIISADVALIELDAHVIDPTKHGYSNKLKSFVEHVETTYQIYTTSAKETQYIMTYPDLAFDWMCDSSYLIFKIVEEESAKGVSMNAYHITSFVDFVETIILTNRGSDTYNNGYLDIHNSINESYMNFKQIYRNKTCKSCVQQYFCNTDEDVLENFYEYIDTTSWVEFGNVCNCIEFNIHYNNQIYDMLEDTKSRYKEE